MARKGCGFLWCGSRRPGESVRFARDATCKRCRAYYSAPSTPRGTRGSSRGSRSRSPTPRGGRGRSHKPAGCFGGAMVTSTHSKYRDARRNINPRALPIVLHPDHKPRKTTPRHACQSPRRGCTDHRCHKEKGWCTIS